MLAARHISDWWRRLVDNWRRRRAELQTALDDDPESSHAWLWSARLRVLDYMLKRYGGATDAPPPVEPTDEPAQIHGSTDGPVARSSAEIRDTLHRISKRTPRQPGGRPSVPHHPAPEYEVPAILLIPEDSQLFREYEGLRDTAEFFTHVATVFGIVFAPVLLIVSPSLGEAGLIVIFGVVLIFSILCVFALSARIRATRLARRVRKELYDQPKPFNPPEAPDE